MTLMCFNRYLNYKFLFVKKEYIQKQSDKEMAKGMAVAGGAALVLGGILGLGIALAKK